MIELGKLQAAFQAHLLDQDSEIDCEIVAYRIGVQQRLHIYHHAYRARLLENLKDAFEKTWSYLGDEQFDAAALAFIAQHPPRERNLRWHGAEFPAWLGLRYPLDADVAELAVMDWQLRRAFDGANSKTLQLADLTQLTPEQWENANFCFAPTLHLSELDFNSVDIWRALDEETLPPPATKLTQPCWLLIWRKEWQPHFRSIDEIEYWALARLLAGATFAEVCSLLHDRWPDHDTAKLAAQFLATWLEDQLICAVVT